MRQARSIPQLDPLRLILVGFAYFAVAFLGLQLASINPSATPIWPATGLALAATLLWGYGIAPAIFIAAFLVNQLTTGSFFPSLAIAVGNTLEAVTAVYLIKFWADGNQVFDTPIGVSKFALIGLAATLISATIGVGSLVLANYADANVVSVWLTWWLGDVAGALVVTPVLVLWARSGVDNFSLGEIAATALTYVAAMAIGAIAFSPLITQTSVRDPLGFLSILPLLWAALRRGPRDTATVALILAAFAVWGTIVGSGPFAKDTLNDSFLLLLMFMITTTVPSLALSADLAERQRAQDQQQLLLREFSGRVGNTLAVVQSVFRGSVQHAGTNQELKDPLESGLMNLAATHTLLSNNEWRTAEIGDLVRAALLPHCHNDYDDCEFVGERLRLPASIVLSLTMILNELATNAAKHGVFNSNGRKLKVVWQEEECDVGKRMLRLDWHESGAANDRQSDYSGYELSLIAAVSALGGDIERESREDGILMRLVLPLT